MVISRKYSIMALALGALIVTSQQASAAQVYKDKFTANVLSHPDTDFINVKSYFGVFYGGMPQINSQEAAEAFIAQLDEETLAVFFNRLGSCLVKNVASLQEIDSTEAGKVYDVTGKDVRGYAQRFFDSRYVACKRLAEGNVALLGQVDVWNQMVQAGFARVDAMVRSAIAGEAFVGDCREAADALAMADRGDDAVDQVLVLFNGLTKADAKPSLAAIYRAFVVADTKIKELIEAENNPSVKVLSLRLHDYIATIFEKDIAVNVEGIPAEALLKEASVAQQVAAWELAYIQKWKKDAGVEVAAPSKRTTGCGLCAKAAVVLVPVVTAAGYALYWYNVATGALLPQ